MISSLCYHGDTSTNHCHDTDLEINNNGSLQKTKCNMSHLGILCIHVCVLYRIYTAILILWNSTD